MVFFGFCRHRKNTAADSPCLKSFDSKHSSNSISSSSGAEWHKQSSQFGDDGNAFPEDKPRLRRGSFSGKGSKLSSLSSVNEESSPASGRERKPSKRSVHEDDGPCTLQNWLAKVMRLPHNCRDTGSTYLDVDVHSLLESITDSFSLAARSLHEASTWMEWCKLNTHFLDGVEKWIESGSPYEPDRQDFAGKSFALRRQLETPTRFSVAMQSSLGLSADFRKLVLTHAIELDNIVDADRDFRFALKGATVMRRYSLKNAHGVCTETPQYVYLRTALCVHQGNLAEVRHLYNHLSMHRISAPSPALAYAGQEGARLATCFTLSKPLRGLDTYDVVHEAALLSFGSCGIHFHEVPRSQLIQTAKLFDAQAKLAGTTNFRMPAQSIYLEPWHDGVEDFLGLKKVLGPEETICRDIHLALWIPDEFMRRVFDDEDWPLLSPDVASDLANCFGEHFTELLNGLVAAGKHTRMIPARQLWREIIASQIECGEPSILFKDAVNRKSNESHIGTIRGSNLCCEIVQFCDSTTTSVCCVMTISLPAFISIENGTRCVDWESLHDCARAMQRMADRISECALELPSERARQAMKTRSLGLGVQGLADALQMLRLDFGSTAAIEMNAKLYEHLYFALLDQSAEMARSDGPYPLCQNSPAKLGRLQWELWAEEGRFDRKQLDAGLDWKSLVSKIQKFGLRNSLLTAQPPTAVSAAIMGNCEGAEPFMNNMYTKSDSNGDYWVINRHLVADLKAIGKYDRTVVEQLIRDKGSVQRLNIPDELKERYMTAWELSIENPRIMVEHSQARGPFIDQAESLNIFLHDGEPRSIEQHLFDAWKAGLKVGMYYLIMRPAREAVAFTVSLERQQSLQQQLSTGKASGSDSVSSGHSHLDGADETIRQSSKEPPPLLRHSSAPLARLSSASGQRLSNHEPLLAENEDRNVLFPIVYGDVWDMYKQACSLLWSADELDYAADVAAFSEQSNVVQSMIKKVLAFFAVADGVVNENILMNFANEVQIPEVKAMYSQQAFMEEVHAETYARLLQAIVPDAHEQRQLLTAHRLGSNAIKAKVQWCNQYMVGALHAFPQRLVAFACVEGIMFSSSFASIFYLKFNKVRMPALTNSNELISRDEGMHRDFAVLLYKKYVKRKLEESYIHSIIKDAVNVEKAFVTEALGENGPDGMSTKDMHTYVEVVADHLSTSLGYAPIFKATNPFPWMEMICSESRTDRFGKRNTAYRLPGELNLEFGSPSGSPSQAAMLSCKSDALSAMANSPSKPSARAIKIDLDCVG
eukprot:TRINITY_DN62906_c0_g1_i1.p1 TRINITY_DN62906_c0_g1~~TRINITY_DN62906_c0_g1_i1.p1  ORF type:complete len:1274 (-),score=148.95 TRINITY_DN62906_c0_g1_i1:320-4141(-)